MSKTIPMECYMIVTRRGIKRVTQGRTPLEVGEFRVKVRVDVPEAWFENGDPVVNIALPEPQERAIEASADVPDAGSFS